MTSGMDTSPITSKEDRSKIENISLDLIENLLGDILLIFVPRHGFWMLPGGHLEFKETMKEAVGREIEEEVRLGKNSTARRTELLLEHEEANEKGHKIFRVFRSCYIGEDFSSVVSPQREEGIEEIGWFSHQEINNLPLSRVASLAIEKAKKDSGVKGVKNLRDDWRDFSQKTREKLQVISNGVYSFLVNLKGEDNELSGEIGLETDEISRLIGKISDSMVSIDEKLGNYLSYKKEEREKAPIIAIIDDEPEMLNTLVEVLTSREGFRAISFDDPQKALDGIKDIYKDERGRIDVAVIDINMPNMRGDILEKKIKRIDEDIKTILISGYYNVKEIPEDRRVLSKPFPLSQLIEEIRSKNK